LTSILERIASGEKEAVQACVDAYGGLVWRLARRYLDRADAFIDDAVQDVFVELWLAAERYDPAQGPEISFVATIAHRRLIDVQRQVTQRRKLENAASDRAHPPKHVKGIDGTDFRALADAFDELPPDERNAL